MTDSAPSAEVWYQRSLLGKLGGAFLICSGTVILLVMPGTDRLVRLWFELLVVSLPWMLSPGWMPETDKLVRLWFELLAVSWPWMLGLGCIAGGIALWRKT